MDYIALKLNDFITEASDFKHTYPAGASWADKTVYGWSKSSLFYKLLLNILDFIEKEPMLNAFYTDKILFMERLVVSNDFIKINDCLFELICKIWSKVPEDRRKEEFLKSYDDAKDECKMDYVHPNIIKDISSMLDKEAYYKIKPKYFVEKEFPYFMQGYKYICLPSFKDYDIKEEYRQYQEEYKKLIGIKDVIRKEKINEFVMFNIFVTTYKDYILEPTMENHSMMQPDEYEINSVDLVNNVIEMLKELKNFYAIKASKNNTSGNFFESNINYNTEKQSEEIMLFYNERNKTIKINNEEYKFSEAQFKTLKIFISSPKQRITAKYIADELKMVKDSARQSVHQLKKACPILAEYIPNSSKYEGGYILKLSKKQIKTY